MASQAPATVGMPPSGANAMLGSPAWLRGIGVRQVRIACGLVMFSYIFSHFFNHVLGNISYATMEWWLRYHIWWWRISIVNFTLYAAAATHFSLGLWALYQRRHFRYAGAEITQLLLGLSIPLWLASHFGVVRIAGLMFDADPVNYASPLFAYWSVRPYMIFVQFALLTVAWTHACIGLYFWLRMKPFFKWAAPILLAVAILLPPLAMIGAHHGAREVIQLAKQPDWRAQNLQPLPPAHRKAVDDVTLLYFPIGYVAAIGLVFAARGVRTLRERRRGMFTVSYPDRQVRVPKGLSVLEVSLRFNVPHASVCGGRARCSTCRIRVISDRGELPPPSRRESFVLMRVGASRDPAVRLACQLRPHADIAVIPLLPPNIGADFVRNRQRVNIGRECYIVSMFVDMRGSTKFAEARLPFDVVFLINRFLNAASQAVIDAGGQPNQFIGDGLLALFGLDVDPVTACRQAMRAAALVATNVEHMNQQFAADLREPLLFGIGIHGGEVIIGDIGFHERRVFTAIGDAVNVAARLQDLTKNLNCQVVISDETYNSAGVDPDALARTEVTIRGRNEPMSVRIAADPTVLASLVQQASGSTKPQLSVA
ncbi:MAG TPA: adenylate/guanylate cyclase domain-containing protein [Pseudolabrys sp.]|nr:adenylate/guanylate cyclase domain-containing protein [Pseudolabrys sp.]